MGSIEQYDSMHPIAAVLQCWVNPGPNPTHHREMQAKLHREWPILAHALERLAHEVTKMHRES